MKKTCILFGLMISLALSVSACNGAGAPASAYENPATIDGDVQTITTRFSSRSYTPITLQAGVPVRWTIQMEQRDLNGCNNEIMISKYNIAQKLSVGETVVEFTPTETGVVPYSCWMGMIRSSITVVDDLSGGADTEPPAAAVANDANTFAAVNDQEPEPSAQSEISPDVASAVVDGDKATVNLRVTYYGYEPRVAIVQRNTPTDFVFDVRQLSCAAGVVFPQRSGYVDLTSGNTVTVTPQEDFDIECTMAMYGVKVLVVDDLNSPEAAELARAVTDNPDAFAYQGTGCGGCCGG